VNQYTLVLIAPSGDTKVIDPRAKEYDVVTSTNGTRFQFKNDEALVMDVHVGVGFSWTIESKSVD
jgi:hypothetical protein